MPEKWTLRSREGNVLHLPEVWFVFTPVSETYGVSVKAVLEMNVLTALHVFENGRTSVLILFEKLV